MKRGREAPPSGSRRAVKAAAALAGACALCWASGALLGPEQPGVAEEAGDMAASWALGSGWGERGEGFAEDAAPAVPEGFEREVVALAGRSEVRAAAQGEVVGYVESMSADQAFSRLSDELAGKGWVAVDGGEATCGTFLKSEGRFRWLFATCTQAGDAAAVVLCCPQQRQGVG